MAIVQWWQAMWPKAIQNNLHEMNHFPQHPHWRHQFPTVDPCLEFLLLIFRDKGKPQAYCCIACVLRPPFWHKKPREIGKTKAKSSDFWTKHPVFSKRHWQAPLLGIIQSLDNCLEYSKCKGSQMSTKFKEKTSSSTNRISLPKPWEKRNFQPNDLKLIMKLHFD